MNKSNVALLVFAIVIPQAILALESTEGTLLYKIARTSRAIRTARAADDNPLQCPPDAMGPVCSTDCKTLLTCVAGNLISSSKCADVSSDYPYCIPNTFGCSSEPDLSYDTCAPRTIPPVEFTCTGQGYFPSPHDCTQYFVCTLDSLYKYECPPNYVFDAQSKSCLHNGVCHIIDCVLSPNKFVSHPGNHAFYAFCTYTEGITEIIMFRCDLWETHIFNPEKIICEFECRAEGWFKHELNPRDFYECYYLDGVLVNRIQSCPGDYIFDAEVRRCVPS